MPRKKEKPNTDDASLEGEVNSDSQISLGENSESPEPSSSSGSSVFPLPKIKKEDVSRVSIVLGPDGNPLWEQMRPTVMGKLKTVFENPSTQQKFGLRPVSAKDVIVPAFPEGATRAVLTVVGKLDAFLISRQAKIPTQTALEKYGYGDLEISLLLPVSQRLLGKYSPAFISENSDILELGLLLAQIHQLHFMAAQMEKAETKTENGVNGKLKVEQAPVEEAPTGIFQ